MKAPFCILVLLVVPGMALATEQVPDILHYDGHELSLSTGWGHPSPLETYYYQSRLAYPFQGHSTNNYRGHIGVWEIANGKLYLTDIQIEDIEPNEARRYGFDFVVQSYEPNEFGVTAGNFLTADNGTVVADWFSGILDCYLAREGSFYASYLFQVRDGNVVDTDIVTDEDYRIFYESPPTTWSEELKHKYKMLLLSDNYVTYYFRLNENDAVKYEGQDCRLHTGFGRLSPVFGLYDNNHLNWPYNWENLEKCGAPHCQWLIEDDRLYLTGMELYSGLSFYTIETETLDMATLFSDRVVDGVVFADWVSGVYLIEHGYVTQEDAGWPGYTFTVFTVTELTLIRMEEGRCIESYTVPKNFDMGSISEDADPGLIQMIKDYELPAAIDTPPTPREREQGQ